jgi:hypothetical protein
MSSHSLRITLASAIAAALAFGQVAHARDLGNYDVNVAALKTRTAQGAEPAAPGTDAIGRETFTWMQQDLPTAAKTAARDPEARARAHLAQLLASAKRAGDALQTLTDARVDRQPGGSSLVRLQPRLDGIAIFREEVALLMDAQQRLVAMRGPLPRETRAGGKSIAPFALDAAAAIAAALRSYEFDAAVATQLQPLRTQGDYQWFALRQGSRSASGASVDHPLRAKRVYFRTGAALEPAWYVETRVADALAGSVDSYAHVISARDGRVLFRTNQSAHAAYAYRIYAEDVPLALPFPSPQGRANTPDPDGLPTNSNTLPYVAQQLRTLANIPFSRAATDHWLPANATATVGNNVFAYADRAAPDGFGPGDLQPGPSAPGVFDYTYTGTLSPTANDTQKSASVVYLFYMVNWLHDWFYDHGFAEIDGNAQADNFGRGGLGNDAIDAAAQDREVNNNANMATPADGASPFMQMGLKTAPPGADYSFDTRTVAHEWGHYLSNRLVGDASGLNTQHAGGLGEGWGDFVAQLVTLKEEDELKPTNASFAGAYGGGFIDHSYYGVRRYPYSTDLGKNPLMLRHIVADTPLPSAPLPRTNTVVTDNTQVHNQGEIWASALWECYAALLNSPRLSFDEAQRRMKTYLVGGLKLTPVDPTIVEARDAVLATVLASGSTEDFALCAAAFAKRGLGAGANVPDRYSATLAGTVESTATGSDIAFDAAVLSVPSGCDADAALDLGETASLVLSVKNAGFAALEGATVALSSSNPALTFPQGATIDIGTLPLFGRSTVSVPVRLSSSVAPNTPVTITMTPNAPGINAPPGIAGSTTVAVNFDQAPRSSSTESFDGFSTDWAVVRDPVGTAAATWTIRNEGAARVLHGEDTGSETVNWTISPVMSVGNGALTLTLRHRHSFESDADERYDGGVIQTSIDGGTSWTDVAAGAAPYGDAPLSACCRNPLAGRPAFVDQSPGYPAFVDQTVNLGTAFANQPNFRVRFGVATDAAVSRNGWDIDSVSVSGLIDTPFASVVPQAGTCSVASGKTLQGAMSGTYYSQARSGEGVLVDFGQVGAQPVVFFSWYTYEGGEQQWLVGSNPFSASDRSVALELVRTRGADFGSAFRPGDVIESAWGSVALSFPDCDTLLLTYQKRGGESGTLTLDRGLERLAPGQCGTLNGGLSGTYYSPQRSGEGVLVDLGRVGSTPVEFFSWYTYEDGVQQWLVGSSPFAAGDATIGVDVIETRGAQFGNGFRAQDVQNLPWGRVTQRFIDCNTLELSYQKSGGESGTLTLQRGLERFGDGVCR